MIVIVLIYRSPLKCSCLKQVGYIYYFFLFNHGQNRIIPMIEDSFWFPFRKVHNINSKNQSFFNIFYGIIYFI